MTSLTAIAISAGLIACVALAVLIACERARGRRRLKRRLGINDDISPQDFGV